MYNRCKRGHLLLATAFHALHLAKSCEEKEISGEDLNELKRWACDKKETFPDNLEVLSNQYQAYCHNTISGNLGKTAQYWMNY